MAEVDLQQAQELLDSHFEPPQQTESTPQDTRPVQTTEVQEQPAPQESFTGLDPKAIPEELQPWYKSMQGDYVRKTQALSERMKALDGLEGTDPRELAEAYNFVTQLQSNPDFALDVHRGLTDALQQMGLTPRQAEQEATRMIDEQTETDDDFNDPRDAAIQELLSWKQQQEQQFREQQIQASLTRQEMQLRQQYPDYSDTDVDNIYKLAFSYGGDLNAANQAYIGMRDEFINRYIQTKTSVPSAPPVGSGSFQTPTKFSSMDEAHKAAEEVWRNHVAGLG